MYNILRVENGFTLVNIDKAVQIVFNLLSTEDKISYLAKLLKYSPTIHESKKLIYNSILNLFYYDFGHNMAQNIVLNYIKEITEDYYLDINFLKKEIVTTEKISFSKWFYRNLMHVSRSGKTLLTTALCSMYMFMHNSNDATALMEDIRQYFLANDISIIILKNFNQQSQKYLALDLRQQVDDTKKGILLKKLEAFSLKGALRVSPTHDELVRYFHALFKYRFSKRRFDDSLYDFAYCFYPARNLDWMKNRVKYLNVAVQNEIQFKNFIYDVRTWAPERFNWNERCQYLESFSISLTLEQKDLMKELVSIDTEFWHQDNIQESIYGVRAVDIFSAVSLTSKNYEALKYQIISWCIPLPRTPYTAEENIITVHDQFSNNCDFSVDFGNDNFDYDYILPTPMATLVEDPISTDHHDLKDVLSVKDYFDNLRELSFLCSKIMPMNSEVIFNENEDDDIIIVQSQRSLEINKVGEFYNESFYETMLFKQYKFKAFNPSAARAKDMSFRKRPTIADWINIVAQWHASKKVSLDEQDSRKVRFNLRRKTGKYLTYTYIVSIILRKFSNSIFTASDFNKTITSSLRPMLKDLELFLISLEEEGRLVREGLLKGKIIFKLVK